jgi:hypothetical protein
MVVVCSVFGTHSKRAAVAVMGVSFDSEKV